MWQKHFGLQGPFNDLTSSYGVRIKYDSALPIRADRTCSFEETFFLRKLVNVKFDPAINMNYLTGASLERPANAEVLLAMKYGFGDIGDVSNDGRNAFLGDYRWDPRTELIGDIVLACRLPVGTGALVAVGDTSIFQNISLMVQDAGLVFLGLSVNKSYGPVPQVVLVFISVIAVMYYMRSALYREISIILLIFALCIMVNVPSSVELSDLYTEQPPRAIIDLSHSATFSTGLWEDNSFTGLALSLRRSACKPKLITANLTADLQNAELLFIPEDNMSYSAAEINTILSWVTEGGTLICGVSGPTRGPILNAIGANVKNIPLGDWPNYASNYEASVFVPEIINGWPIEDSIHFRSRSLFSVWDDRQIKYDLVKEFEVGNGTIVILGDTQMFTNTHLEGEDTWKDSNLHFVEDLLDYLR